MIRLIFLIICVTTTCNANSEHPGHMKPFGIGLKTLQPMIRHDSLTPMEFNDLHIVPSTPVLFKGMAKSFPGYDNLRNDTYLSEKYGKWKVTYEPTTKEIVQKVFKQSSFKKYLENYQKKGFYMVSDIMHGNPLKNEVTVPKPIMCDGMIGHLESCIMWFSGGNTRSLIHFDSPDNLNCLYDGVKDVYMASPKYEDSFYYDENFSSVDTDKVDYEKYPKLLQVPWYYAKVEAGDCLFIPSSWAHHIKSHGPRNLAINMMWDHLGTFPKKEECQKSSPTSKDEILSQVKQVSKEERARSIWIQHFHEANMKDNMPVDKFCKVIMDEQENEEEGEEMEPEECHRLFSKLDGNQDKAVTFDELYKADMKMLKPYLKSVLSGDAFSHNWTGYEEVNPNTEKDEL